jgi:hypothetical protein
MVSHGVGIQASDHHRDDQGPLGKGYFVEQERTPRSGRGAAAYGHTPLSNRDIVKFRPTEVYGAD